MTARRCKAGDLSAEPLALPDPVVASGLDGKMCSTPAGILGWLHGTRISCGRSMYCHRDPGLLRRPPAFPFLLWNAPTSCDAMRCAAAAQHARYVDARKQRVASQGAERPLQPWFCERRDAGAVPGCLGLWPYWGREGLCAHPQYWRRSLRKLPEGRAAGGKLKSGQVEARETTSGSAVVARILRGRLRRQGPALQWTRSQCKKRRSLCDRHRVRALERAKARADGQGWAGLSGGRWVGGRGKCRSRSRSRSCSCSWRSQFTPFAVGVGVAIAIAKQAGLVGPQHTGDWAGQNRTGTGTRVQARAQTQAQGWRVGHRILAVWDETRLYEVCRACKRVAVGGVVCCSYPSTYIECCIWQR